MKGPFVPGYGAGVVYRRCPTMLVRSFSVSRVTSYVASLVGWLESEEGALLVRIIRSHQALSSCGKLEASCRKVVGG